MVVFYIFLIVLIVVSLITGIIITILDKRSISVDNLDISKEDTKEFELVEEDDAFSDRLNREKEEILEKEEVVVAEPIIVEEIVIENNNVDNNQAVLLPENNKEETEELEII